MSEGYASGMKTAVSIPDEIFLEADGLARRQNKSRSQLYSQAIREYLRRHSPDAVTESMNRVIDELGGDEDVFVSEAAARILKRVDW